MEEEEEEGCAITRRLCTYRLAHGQPLGDACKVLGIRGYEYSGLAFAVMKIRLARSYGDDDGGHVPTTYRLRAWKSCTRRSIDDNRPRAARGVIGGALGRKLGRRRKLEDLEVTS